MTVRILRGDVRARLADIEPESVNCIVTSPPYWGLRSYLPVGHPDKHLEIGSERSVEAWVETMVGVMRLARAALRKDGTVFLNLGDSYAGSRCGPDEMARDSGKSTLGGSRRSRREASAARAMTSSRRRDGHEIPRSDLRMAGLKEKDLVGQPWMLAFALRADGWWLRQEVIWAKPNPMPESTRDRFTKAHEHVFVLSRSKRYYWNFEATQEDVNGGAHARGPGNVRHVKHADSLAEDRDGEHRTKGGLVAYAERKRAQKAVSGWDTSVGEGTGHRGKAGRYTNNGVGFGHGFDDSPKPRVVSVFDGSPFAKARAGVNPKALMGASDSAYVDGKSDRLGRGPGWRGAKQNESFSAAVVDIVDTRNPRSVQWIDEDEFAQFLAWKAAQPIAPDVWDIPTHPFKGAHFATFPPEFARRCIVAGTPPGGTVLDPFFGAGTVGLVADQLGMHAIGIELDDRSSDMAQERILGDSPLFAEVGA